jgi:hypothetical protein
MVITIVERYKYWVAATFENKKEKKRVMYILASYIFSPAPKFQPSRSRLFHAYYNKPPYGEAVQTKIITLNRQRRQRKPHRLFKSAFLRRT